jgi:hypothetical protein
MPTSFVANTDEGVGEYPPQSLPTHFRPGNENAARYVFSSTKFPQRPKIQLLLTTTFFEDM